MVEIARRFECIKKHMPSNKAKTSQNKRDLMRLKKLNSRKTGACNHKVRADSHKHTNAYVGRNGNRCKQANKNKA
ncbi:hypothetical protein KUL113_26960 [Tenacibaculum sp. KUL113]|nr:hypothetical protein KUL113_26960 [Tenacibaculum sp. KUL113]GFD85388.1 hypothetical protein KUL150_14470 [Alteromonas sp. KUL150]